MLGLGALVLFASVLISSRRGAALTAQTGATDSGDDARILEGQTASETNFVAPIELPPDRSLASASAKEKSTRPAESVVAGQDEQREVRVAARIAELWDLSARTDRASLETLLSEVKNRDQEIRQAALDAISQSGNRAAIPGLRVAAAQTEDSQEKQAIADVIEFMSLPTLTELFRGSATNNPRPAQAKPTGL